MIVRSPDFNKKTSKRSEMNKYKIMTKTMNKRIKTSLPLSFLETSPALFFLCDGEYQVQKCGQITAIKQLKSHLKTIIKKMGINNEA